MILPDKFEIEMKRMLGDEYADYLSCFDRPRYFGLRVNTAKISVERFLEISPWHLEQIPWIPNGFYYNEDDQPSKHPYYYAGLYYLQEPSAMTPANLLPIEEGEKVLDLCAAPGGKSTELAAKLNGSGFLVANDISSSRSRALLKNLEVFGIPNILVTCEEPVRLSGYFHEYFDKILVDAPCSGEGMFRKDRRMIRAWEEHGPDYFGKIQRSVTKAAVEMLKPGGMMMYSTCTFSSWENEGTINELISAYPEMHILHIDGYTGFSRGLPEMLPDGKKELEAALRIWPQRMQGEGHFLVLLKKDTVSEREENTTAKCLKTENIPEEIAAFLSDTDRDFEDGTFMIQGERVYFLKKDMPQIRGLRIMRSGLLLGEYRKKRFEPSQALAMSLYSGGYASTLDLKSDDIRALKYLKGETIDVKQGETSRSNGWQLVETDGFPLGWGKLSDGCLKNKYLPGWRMV